MSHLITDFIYCSGTLLETMAQFRELMEQKHKKCSVDNSGSKL